MLKKSSATLLVLALGFGASAFASGFAYPVANETGTAYRNPEYALRNGALVRVDDLSAPSAATQAGDAPMPGAFTYRGDGIGWEVIPHDFALSGSHLAHSDKCDHMMHAAAAPTTSEVDAMRLMSPG
jgi:hypothetical protein